jgi:modification methylase
VAQRLGRCYIGLEREPAYAAAARDRIALVQPLPDDAIAQAPSKRGEPRVPFSAVIESGLIAPGALLRDERRRFEALVRADGALLFQGMVGSIHKIGALAQGLPACNGWTFWRYESEGAFQPIDQLRSILRKSFEQAAA